VNRSSGSARPDDSPLVIVDGADVLAHLTETGDPLAAPDDRGAGQGNVTRWLGRYCEMRQCDAVLYFRSQEPGEVRTPTQRFGRVTVVNVPYGTEYWKDMAASANASALERPTYVVATDWRLRDAVGRGRVRALSPEQLVARVRRSTGVRDGQVPDEPDAKFTGVADEEVGFWLEYFRDDETSDGS